MDVLTKTSGAVQKFTKRIVEYSIFILSSGVGIANGKLRCKEGTRDFILKLTLVLDLFASPKGLA